MYHIDSKVNKPDIAYMKKEVEGLMKRGIEVGDLKALHLKFMSEKNEIAAEITNNYGILNPNSPKQLVAFLENVNNAEVYEACFVDNKWTTNKDALSTLSLLGYQFATDILDYRKAKKYAESIKSMMDAVGSDGRVHPIVTLTKTNRISYDSPALMNIPKPLLWHIIKPLKAGNVLISADIKNQEPSILINILNAESLKQALTDEKGLYENLFTKPFKAVARLNILVTKGHTPGNITNTELAELGYVPPVYYTPDVPAVTSSYYNNSQIRVIDVTSVVVPGDGTVPTLPDTVVIETIDGEQHRAAVVWDKYDAKKLSKPGIIEVKGEVQGVDIRCEGIARKEFKVAWNAMTYGASAFGVKRICKHIEGDSIYSYFSKIEEFKKYRQMCKQRADAGEQYINTYFGTRLYADEFESNRLRRVLMDLPIQGTAADILSLLLKNIDYEINKRGFSGLLSVYYTRHDEIIFEADIELVNKVGIENTEAMVRDLTEHQVDNWIPFKVEVGQVRADTLYIDEVEDIFD